MNKPSPTRKAAGWTERDIERILVAIGPPAPKDIVVRILSKFDPPAGERGAFLDTLLGVVPLIRKTIAAKAPAKIKRDLEVLSAAMRRARVAMKRMPEPERFVVFTIDEQRFAAELDRFSDRAKKQAASISKAIRRSGGSAASRKVARQKDAAVVGAFSLASRPGWSKHFPPEGEQFYELCDLLFKAAIGRSESCKRAAVAFLRQIYGLTPKREWRRRAKARTT